MYNDTVCLSVQFYDIFFDVNKFEFHVYYCTLIGRLFTSSSIVHTHTCMKMTTAVTDIIVFYSKCIYVNVCFLLTNNRTAGVFEEVMGESWRQRRTVCVCYIHGGRRRHRRFSGPFRSGHLLLSVVDGNYYFERPGLDSTL